MAHITVRDGRAGHPKDPDGRGAVLGAAQTPDLLDIGEVIALSDGARVIIIGVEDVLGGEAEGMDPMSQTVFVGSLPEAPATAQRPARPGFRQRIDPIRDPRPP